MSVHENDKTVSIVPLVGNPDLATVAAADSAIAAFRLALKELGEPVPANDVRAVLTTSGLRLEVTAAPTTTVEHYGTPAPVAEIAEFIGDEPTAEATHELSVGALDRLPVGARVRDMDGDTWTKEEGLTWSLGDVANSRRTSEYLYDVWGPIDLPDPKAEAA